MPFVSECLMVIFINAEIVDFSWLQLKERSKFNVCICLLICKVCTNLVNKFADRSTNDCLDSAPSYIEHRRV